MHRKPVVVSRLLLHVTVIETGTTSAEICSMIHFQSKAILHFISDTENVKKITSKEKINALLLTKQYMTFLLNYSSLL